MKQINTLSLSAAFAAALLGMPASGIAQEDTRDNPVATFEDLNLEADKYWCGPADNAETKTGAYRPDEKVGTFKSGSYEFINNYTPAWSSWTGCSYSSMTSTNFTTYTTDQWNSAVGHGADNSATYGVIYGSSTPAQQMEVIKVADTTEGQVIKGMNITNSAWVVECVKNGNGTATKFTQGSWFKVTFTGVRADKSTAGSVDYYLADYRSENEAEWKVLTDWDWIDLSSLGKVVALNISFNGSDTGTWGLNTATYVCIDNVGCEKNTATSITNVDKNLIEVYEVARFTVDGKRIYAPQKGINIIRMSDGTTRKVVVE